MKQPIITLALTLLATTSYAADVYYKWVDEYHVTHYSQSYPENLDKGLKVETVNVRTRIPMDSQKEIAALEDKRADSANKATKEAKKETTTASRKMDKQSCDQLRSDAELLEAKAQIRVLDDKGNASVLSEEEKQKRMEQTQKQLKDYCS